MTENSKQVRDPFLSFFEAYADTEEAMSDISRGHEVHTAKQAVISTGSLVLDEALSSGGYPCGRLIQLYGPPGSGKTLLSMIAIIEAQKQSPTARQMFIDSEGTFDRSWAAQLGVNLSRVMIINGDMAVIGRKCFEMLLGVPKEDAKTHAYRGQSKNGLLDEIANKKLEYNLIVLDSLGSLIPPGEDISAVGKMNISLLARFLTTTLRKVSLQVRKANIPFIIINHKKANMDPYASDHTYSGGNAYSHFLSANIYVETVNRAEARILDDKEQKIGQRVRATVEKSKFGPSPRKCEFNVEFSRGIINREEEIAQLATEYELIEHPTTVSYLYGDHKWVGQGKMHEAIASDIDLQNELIIKISEARDLENEAKLASQTLISAQLAGDTKAAQEATIKIADIEVSKGKRTKKTNKETEQ